MCVIYYFQLYTMGVIVSNYTTYFDESNGIFKRRTLLPWPNPSQTFTILSLDSRD